MLVVQILCMSLLHTLTLLFILFVQTALHYAALKNEADIANVLLVHGVNAKILDDEGICDV